MDDLRRHLDHFLALGGEKTVALGGDWDGCDPPSGWVCRDTGAGLDFYEYLLRAKLQLRSWCSDLYL